MSTTSQPNSTWSRTDRLVLIALVGGILASLPFLVHPWFDADTDESIYLITARALAAGEGYSYLEAPFRVRPPGLSALLSPFVAGEKTDFFHLNLMMALFGGCATVLLFVHQRSRVGTWLAFFTALAVFLNPGYQWLCNRLMSELPGLALVMTALLCERWCRQRPSWLGEVMLGLCIAAAAYVRWASLLLIPAIAISRICHAKHTYKAQWRDIALRRILLFSVVAGLAVLPWNLRNRAVTPSPPVDQTLNFTLWTALWHHDPGDPDSRRVTVGEFLERPVDHSIEIANVLGNRMTPKTRTKNLSWGSSEVKLHLGISLVLLACLVTVLIKRREPAEFLAGGTLAFSSIYFDFVDRLILVTFIFSLAATVEVLHAILRSFAGQRLGTLVLSLLLMGFIAAEFEPRHRWNKIRKQHENMTTIADELKHALEPSARIGSRQGFLYSAYLKRPVFVFKYAIRRHKRRPEAAEGIIDKYDLDTIVLSPLVSRDKPLIKHFTKDHGSGRNLGSVVIWKLRD